MADSAGARHDEVGGGEGVGQFVDGARGAAGGVGEAAGGVERAVDDRHLAKTVTHERVGGEGAHGARPDDDGAHTRQVAEHVARQVEGALDEGAADGVDARLGVHALADAQRLLHEPRHDGADAPGALPLAQALAQLGEDLALPHRE